MVNWQYLEFFNEKLDRCKGVKWDGKKYWDFPVGGKMGRKGKGEKGKMKRDRREEKKREEIAMIGFIQSLEMVGWSNDRMTD